jgi:HPt (histidine-containing phosphotransfer) domain-containing protein
MEVELALSRMGGDQGLLQRAIVAYAADAGALTVRLEQGLQQGLIEQVRRDLHGAKGLSATIGAAALALLAAQAEKLAQGPQVSEHCRQAVAQFTAQLAAQLPALEEVAIRLRDGDGDAGQAASAAQRAQPDPLQLRALMTALQSADMVAMELHAMLGQQLGGEWAETMAPLDRAMAELEFETAAIECEKLVHQFDRNKDRLET